MLYNALWVQLLFLCKLLSVYDHQHHRRKAFDSKGDKCVAKQEEKPILVFVAGPAGHQNENVYSDEEYVRNQIAYDLQLYLPLFGSQMLK